MFGKVPGCDGLFEPRDTISMPFWGKGTSLTDKSSRTEVFKCSLQGAGGLTSLYVQPVRGFLLNQGIVFIWGIYCTVDEGDVAQAWQPPDGEGDCEWD